MDSKPNTARSSKLAALASPIAILLAVLAVLWLVELLNRFVWSGQLGNYGIRPRTIEGLWRIPSAPFLHADFNHLLANSIPLLILGWMVVIRNKWHFPLVFVLAALISGLGIWLLAGANTIHIGASGVVFGFLGYLVARGYFERGFVSILFGIIALFLYGGILIGVLPGRPGVSWLGHLFGLAGGVLAAYLTTRPWRRNKSVEPAETGLQQTTNQIQNPTDM
jgi:membrane associated rhomboid family serine protease